MSDERSFIAVVTATPGGGKVTFKRYPDAAPESQPKLAAYSPTIGDPIWVVRVGSGWLAVGKLG